MYPRELGLQLVDAQAIYQEAGIESAFHRSVNKEFLKVVDFGVFELYQSALLRGAFKGVEHTIKDMETEMTAVVWHDIGKLLVPEKYLVGYLPPEKVLEIYGGHCSDSVYIVDQVLGLLGDTVSPEAASLMLNHHVTGSMLGKHAEYYRNRLPDPGLTLQGRLSQARVTACDVIHARATRSDRSNQFASRQDFHAILNNTREKYATLRFDLPFDGINVNILIEEAMRLQESIKQPRPVTVAQFAAARY